MTGKPPYAVPSVAEIAATPWNGFTVASFFAGAGGSSTGYRMAGFRVLYANEFVPIAQESYRENARPGTFVDGRDVRDVTAESVLDACGLARGELDVLDGSPPCQAFSTAGQREKGWGKDKKYEHGAKQKNEDLFFEFVRLRDGIQPRVFVAENVSGLVKGTAKGYFLEILAALKVGYRVKCRLLDAQWLGVPQARQRVIFVGVREDLELDPAFPTPLPYRYSVREALPWLDGGGLEFVSGGNNQAADPRASVDEPIRTVAGAKTSTHHRVVYDDKRPGHAAKNILDRPAPTIVAGRNSFDVKVVGNKNAAHSSKGERRSVDEPARTLQARRANLELERVTGEIVYRGQNGGQPYGERRRSIDEPSAAITGDGYASANKSQYHVETRKLREGDSVPENVAPSIDGLAIGEEWDRMAPGQQSERFFSLVKPNPEDPCPTLTAAGGGTSIASVTHPTEKRKFTILEVKRLCSFPDDFVLKGTYGQQWERLGNSVPPVMMRHIAEAIRDRVLIPARDAGKIPAPRPRSGPRSTSGSPPKGAGSEKPQTPSSGSPRTSAKGTAPSRRKSGKRPPPPRRAERRAGQTEPAG